MEVNHSYVIVLVFKKDLFLMEQLNNMHEER
jgi:hypothetical protein